MWWYRPDCSHSNPWTTPCPHGLVELTPSPLNTTFLRFWTLACHCCPSTTPCLGLWLTSALVGVPTIIAYHRSVTVHHHYPLALSYRTIMQFHRNDLRTTPPCRARLHDSNAIGFVQFWWITKKLRHFGASFVHIEHRSTKFPFFSLGCPQILPRW